ncbi:CopG family transcriptional regulator [Aeromonas salmonicida]|uniref:CopG family transcriptional regulator n=1 Tax=Aeromonas salmonicida TaxID=645 RepID=UPI00259E6612|nr:CopG family transcriptional regulator [Aeromonas salmonicida]MDM5128471.1 CopG family transcriptional regulator [Aeromonas salmonicida]
MGLADLKKKHNLHHQKKFTIDEFIEDADFYAKGKPKVVSLELSLHRDEALTALAFIERGEHLKTSYKKATFSLSTAAIDELGNLTQQDGMNKSLLLRLFTHYFSSLSPEERQTIYERLQEHN